MRDALVRSALFPQMTPIASTMTERMTEPSFRPVTGLIDWLLRYFRENPLKAISTGTFTFGSLLLIPVFLAIEELPLLDIPSMLPLVATVAAGGLLITLSLVAMPATAGWLARSKPDAPVWQSDWYAVFIYVMPGLVIASALWGLLWLDRYADIAPDVLLVLTLTGPLLAAVRVATLFRGLPDKKAVFFGWAVLAWNSFVATALSSYLVIMSIQIVASEARSIHALAFNIAAWALYAASVTALAVRVTNRELLPWLLGAAFVVAVALLVATGGMTSTSKAMLRKAGWGDYPAKLFVTDRGCDILNRSTGHIVCKKEPAGGANLVCPVVVRSRIGTPHYLSFSAFTSSGAWPNRELTWGAALPKDDVIVAQRIAVRKSSTTSSAQAREAPGPATYLVAESALGHWMIDQCGAAGSP